MTAGKTGTREWAENSFNIQRGCEHNCRYCYARSNAVARHHLCTVEQWVHPVINSKKVDVAVPLTLRPGWVMFPTTHDITPLNSSEYMVVLRKLLETGWHVLVVTKPHLACIKLICEVFASYRDKITFRFTIGSIEDAVLKFWDRDAPLFQERWDALRYAFGEGYTTSISCEPFLDIWPGRVYDCLHQWVNDSIWFGKLNHWESRVRLDGASKADILQYVNPLKAAQGDAFIMKFVKSMQDKPLVRWKDSIAEVLVRCQTGGDGGGI